MFGRKLKAEVKRLEKLLCDARLDFAYEQKLRRMDNAEYRVKYHAAGEAAEAAIASHVADKAELERKLAVKVSKDDQDEKRTRLQHQLVLQGYSAVLALDYATGVYPHIVEMGGVPNGK